MQKVFQILPIEEVFFVDIGSEDIVIGAPKVVKLPQCKRPRFKHI